MPPRSAIRRPDAQVVRDPASGLLLRVDSFYANASSLNTDGFDLSRRYEFRAAAGRHAARRRRRDVHLRATTRRPAGRPSRRRRQAQLRQLRHVDAALALNALRRRGSRERHAVNVFVRYIDSYIDDEVDLGQGPESYRQIGSFTTFDAQYSLRLGRPRPRRR